MHHPIYATMSKINGLIAKICTEEIWYILPASVPLDAGKILCFNIFYIKLNCVLYTKYTYKQYIQVISCIYTRLVYHRYTLK